MLSRISSVQDFKAEIVAFSSVIQIGDSSFVNTFTRALAVQREEEFFIGSEGSFDAFSIFKEPIPIPPITEKISISRQNLSPVINVSRMNIIGTSASSIIHIGSTCHVQLESRVKHIRQLKTTGKKPEIPEA